MVSEKNKKYYRAGFTAGKGNKVTLKSDVIVSDCKDFDSDIKNNLVSSLTFSDKYFNDKLALNCAIFHNYSEYYIDDQKEILNNLSFNFRVKIVNFEFYFGSDNFLKRNYRIGNMDFDLNEHYVYRTIENFDMRTHDEIWGIKWIFYR
jgi:hypothetical protein